MFFFLNLDLYTLCTVRRCGGVGDGKVEGVILRFLFSTDGGVVLSAHFTSGLFKGADSCLSSPAGPLWFVWGCSGIER